MAFRDDDSNGTHACKPAKLEDRMEECLLDSRTVILSVEVTGEGSGLYRKLAWLYAKDPGKEVRIILNSPGGEVYDGITIYNMIRHFTGKGMPVEVEVMGLCASMATVVLQAATRRVACRHTRFLLHEVSEFKLFSDETATEKEEEARELGIVNRMLAGILAERAGRQVEDVLMAIKRHELWMSAEEAREWGLVDEVR